MQNECVSYTICDDNLDKHVCRHHMLSLVEKGNEILPDRRMNWSYAVLQHILDILSVLANFHILQNMQ